MRFNTPSIYGEEVLAHHGILGQKWGVRRFQNADGSLTDAGKKRYSKEEVRYARKELPTERQRLNELQKKASNIESNTEYSDNIYDLLLEARDGWNYEKNEPLSDKEIDANWDNFDKAYKKALNENKEYQQIIKDIEKSKQKVSELEDMAQVRNGEKFANATLQAIGTTSALVVVMSTMYLLANKPNK